MHESESGFNPEDEHTSPENCFARVGKGGSAEGLPREMLVVDTGQPNLPPVEMRFPKTQREVDELYRWTIRNGIVDHHGIDASVLEMPAGVERRCAAKMVADFPDEVVALIKNRDIRSVSGHTDSDLDSITATYLTKILVDTRRSDALPVFTADLGAMVNQVDFGRLSETDPDVCVRSLFGYFGALKTQTLGRLGAEMGALWRSEDIPGDEKPKRAQVLSDRFHGELMKHMFAVYNACVKSESSGTKVDFVNLDAANLALPIETKHVLEEGKKEVKAAFEVFNKEFKTAERTEITVMTKAGSHIQVPLLLFAKTSESPLLITNMTYSRMPPETIVAVYAGQDRTKGGDCYDIGIKPETLDVFNLTFLEVPLNEAEAELRAPILADLRAKEADGTLTELERGTLTTWTTLRKGKEYLGHGDPTVAVAGGSLIAASNTALLTPESFRQVLENVFRKE